MGGHLQRKKPPQGEPRPCGERLTPPRDQLPGRGEEALVERRVRRQNREPLLDERVRRVPRETPGERVALAAARVGVAPRLVGVALRPAAEPPQRMESIAFA